MNNRVTTDEVAQEFAKAIKLLLEWAKQEMLVPTTGGIGKLATDRGTSDNKPSDQERLLKPAEIASILQISKSQAYILMQRGEIPTIRIGSSVRVRRDDLEAYIKQSMSA
jgi:excisionase family DNA binding protein